MSLPGERMASRLHRIVGVIGGMGPEATVELMRRVIAKTPAQDDGDHVHLIVESNPKIPSRIAHLIDATGVDPTPELVRIAQNLERAGAHVLAMPCNTAHAYADSIRRSVRAPLLDMIALTAEQIVRNPEWRKVLLLASTAVHRTRLFHEALRQRGVELLAPARQADLMGLIKGVKRGETGAAAQDALAQLTLEAGGEADVVLIACSELSVIAERITVPAVDSLDVLAQAIVNFVAC